LIGVTEKELSSLKTLQSKGIGLQLEKQDRDPEQVQNIGKYMAKGVWREKGCLGKWK
jgi:hypothetical protein